MLTEAAFSNAFHVAKRRVVFDIVHVCHTLKHAAVHSWCCYTSGKGGLFQVVLKKRHPFLNVRVFELYKYTSTIFDSFAPSLPNQAARHVDWRRKQ